MTTNNPFLYASHPRDSIFMSDTKFTGCKKNGKTASQVSAASVEAITARTGRNPGSIRGISHRGNLRIEESENKRRAARG